MKKSSKDIFPIGLMVFSTFFGAGNLIFPPYLGMMGGGKWFIAFLGFVIGDVLLAVLASSEPANTMKSVPAYCLGAAENLPSF